RPTANSLDAVSDRDFALDYLWPGTLAALHSSAPAREMTRWGGYRSGSVHARTFALHYLMPQPLCALLLSRLAEEIILWGSQPFGFVALADSFSTGSSIMPQQRKPPAARPAPRPSG